MNPFSFKGRMRRTVYTSVVFIYISFLFFFIIRFVPSEFGQRSGYYNDKGLLPATLILLTLLWVLTSSSVKRIHDMGYAGWWQLLVCVFPLLIFGLIMMEGQDRSNCYGENPRETENMSLANTLLMRFIQFLLYTLICIIVMAVAYIGYEHIFEWYMGMSKFWFVVNIIFLSVVQPYACTFFSKLFLTLLLHISPFKWFGSILISTIALFIGGLFCYAFWANENVYSGWEIFVAIAFTWLTLESTFSIIIGSLDGLLYHSKYD